MEHWRNSNSVRGGKSRDSRLLTIMKWCNRSFATNQKTTTSGAGLILADNNMAPSGVPEASLTKFLDRMFSWPPPQLMRRQISGTNWRRAGLLPAFTDFFATWVQQNNLILTDYHFRKVMSWMCWHISMVLEQLQLWHEVDVGAVGLKRNSKVEGCKTKTIS